MPSDNIFYSYAQFLLAVTRNNWTNTMYNTMRVLGEHTWVLFYMAQFIGGYFGTNMIVAVLKVNYA
jgi:hypothetical protein